MPSKSDSGKQILLPSSKPDFESDILSQHNLLKNVSYSLLEPVLAECSIKHLAKGEILMSPGEENHHLYLLIDGYLRVHLDAADALGASFPVIRGGCVGEMSIIENRLTSAYVIAEENSSLIAVPEAIFWDKLIQLPGVFKNLLQVMARRMRRVNEAVLRAQEQDFKYRQLQHELEAAGKIQANILPKGDALLPNCPQVDVHAMLQPAREVGGDFFDVFVVNRRHIYVVIGDVCDKGMPAALFMVRVLAQLRTSMKNNASLSAIIPAVNQMLCQNNDDCMFVSLFVGLLDVESGQFTYVNGGHNPPFFARNGEPFDLLPVPKGMVLGIDENAPYPAAKLTFHPGDTLVLYTDGVTEAHNQQQEVFSVERARQTLQLANKMDSAGAGGSAGASDSAAMLKALEDAVAEFSQGQPPSDDITMLALRYKGSGD